MRIPRGYKTLAECLKEAGGKLPIKVSYGSTIGIPDLPDQVTIIKISHSRFWMKELDDGSWGGAMLPNWRLVEDE